MHWSSIVTRTILSALASLNLSLSFSIYRAPIRTGALDMYIFCVREHCLARARAHRFIMSYKDYSSRSLYLSLSLFPFIRWVLERQPVCAEKQVGQKRLTNDRMHTSKEEKEKKNNTKRGGPETKNKVKGGKLNK